MKTGIAVILTILMLFTSTSGLWYAVDMQNSSDGFTPVAKIENDDYVTYADRNKAANVTVEKLDLTSEEYILTVTVMTVDAQMKLINGKQNFKVNVSNISDIDSAIALNIYVNGELYKVERSFVSAGGNNEFDIAFDEIKEGDYVYFSVESEEREFYKDDNVAGIYSVQTETAPEELVDNVYRQQLQDIKKLMR